MDNLVDSTGQEQVRLTLRRALETEKISHAYLFVGPSGVGKKTTAAKFAQALILAGDTQAEAYLKADSHPDLMIIDKKENKTLIGIEQINREMEPWLALKPYRARRRVAVINDAHLLSLPAANALLKTLEDPPGHAVLILIADQQNLLETIVSRCQLVRFTPASTAEIQKILEDRGVAPERAGYLAQLGQGSIAAALQLAEEEGLEELWQTARSIMKDLAAGREIEVLRCAEQIEKNPVLLSGLLTTLLRDIFIFQAAGQPKLLEINNDLGYYEGFKALNPSQINKVIGKIDELRRQYRSSVNSLLLSINISYQLRDALK